MAGIIEVYRTEGWEGCINISSERLRWMLAYLTQCQAASSVLQADASFDPWKDMLASNYCTLVDYSDATVAEIARLLIEGTEPSHPFWSDGKRFFDPNYGSNKELDPEAEIKLRQIWTQNAFREVAALIQQRLSLTKAAGEHKEIAGKGQAT